MRLQTLLATSILLLAAYLLIQFHRDHVGATRNENNTITSAAPKSYKIDGLIVVHVNETANYISDELNLPSSASSVNTSHEVMDYKITARIVEILPNGNLALEARRSMRIDDELIETTLTGNVRPEEILPRDIVPSEKLGELTIERRHSKISRPATLLSQFERWQWFVVALIL